MFRYICSNLFLIYRITRMPQIPRSLFLAHRDPERKKKYIYISINNLYLFLTLHFSRGEGNKFIPDRITIKERNEFRYRNRASVRISLTHLCWRVTYEIFINSCIKNWRYNDWLIDWLIESRWMIDRSIVALWFESQW